VLRSLFRNKVHLGNRCCCCNKPGAAGCSPAPSPQRGRGESGPAAVPGAAPTARTGCLHDQNLPVQLQSHAGRAAIALDKPFLHAPHPSHPCSTCRLSSLPAKARIGRAEDSQRQRAAAALTKGCRSCIWGVEHQMSENQQNCWYRGPARP